MQSTIDTLLKNCKRGDEKAQVQLYDRYCNAMFAVACRYLKNQEDAKDAMQEGFIKAFQKLETYSNDFSFGAWLKRIVINQCLDKLKSKKLSLTSLTEENMEILDDENWNVDISITKEMVDAALGQLARKYQLVIKLYLMEGYDHEEISEILNIPIKTSRTQLRRGRLQLKELLKKKYYAAGS
ncbi:RNA polymerase sigma factor [Spongiimicrobium salis]|uniref:RNA polymerase sigma factor n=1 Tax=Spongiimicrobium salis TaxID=1667022 RepID=UPI00374CCF6B